MMASKDAFFPMIFATILLSMSVTVNGIKNCSYVGKNTTCLLGTYFDTTKQVCTTCKKCRVGKGVRCPCLHHANTKCEWCSKGTFSKHDKGNRFCTACTRCRAFEQETSKCNKTNDAICLSNYNQQKGQDDTTYKIIIAVLVVLVVVVVSILGYLICKVYANRSYSSRERYMSSASEAHYGEGSSSDLDWRKDRLNLPISSFSSQEDNWRRRDDGDSIQSSLISSDNHSGSERPSTRTLQYPDTLVNSLPATVYEDLGKLLNPDRVYRDWKTLAGKLGKTKLDIEMIKSLEKYTCTENLLMDWCAGRPDATIGQLFKLLVDMKREDAATVLLDFDREKASQQQLEETPSD